MRCSVVSLSGDIEIRSTHKAQTLNWLYPQLSISISSISISSISCTYGLPCWFSSRESTCSSGDKGDMGLIHGSQKSPGEEITTHYSSLAWKITLSEVPGSYSPQGCKESNMTECMHTWTHTHTHTHTHLYLYLFLFLFLSTQNI